MFKLTMENIFLQQAGVKYPLICGPMYPCSNPELVAAVSEAGGLGIIQPVSLSYVHGYPLREGIRYIRRITDKPVGMNLLIEKSSRRYHQKMQSWMDIALDEGVNFFITSLGKPEWVVEKAHQAKAYVYHDVTQPRWAEIAIKTGVDGLIAVNNRAGGHAGNIEMAELYTLLKDSNLPLVAAGGISDKDTCHRALDIGYSAVQMGTRFIATKECSASMTYKQAILSAKASDIVLTKRITGIPVSVIDNDYVRRQGTQLNRLEEYAIHHQSLKSLMRMIKFILSMRQLKRSMFSDKTNNDYWQAGKSVEYIHSIESVDKIVADIVRGS